VFAVSRGGSANPQILAFLALPIFLEKISIARFGPLPVR
jgi:hypothetical protein